MPFHVIHDNIAQLLFLFIKHKKHFSECIKRLREQMQKFYIVPLIEKNDVVILIRRWGIS